MRRPRESAAQHRASPVPLLPAIFASDPPSSSPDPEVVSVVSHVALASFSSSRARDQGRLVTKHAPRLSASAPARAVPLLPPQSNRPDPCLRPLPSRSWSPSPSSAPSPDASAAARVALPHIFVVQNHGHDDSSGADRASSARLFPVLHWQEPSRHHDQALPCDTASASARSATTPSASPCIEQQELVPRPLPLTAPRLHRHGRPQAPAAVAASQLLPCFSGFVLGQTASTGL
nr:uncharacterized protein LOC109774687 [Aegilops tauschii subsp. strangulata]